MDELPDGTPIEPEEAWRIFDKWKASAREIGVIFWGRSGNLYTSASIHSAANGRLELRGEATRASFNLAGAIFRYGPMTLWNHWPSSQTAEVMALRAVFDNGDYLALAEGLRPNSLPPTSLPN